MQGSGNADVGCLQLAACSLSVFLENNVSQLMTPLCRPTWNANKVFNHLAAETKTLNTCAGRGWWMRGRWKLRLRWRLVHAGATKPQGERGSDCCVNAAVKRTRCVWQLFVGRVKRGFWGGGWARGKARGTHIRLSMVASKFLST